MEKIRKISKEQVVMAFVATCIETTARQLNTNYNEIYYNPQNEMVSTFGNETFFFPKRNVLFFAPLNTPYPALFRLISHF